MTDTTKTIKVYTNDLAAERVKQETAAQDANKRLGTLRNRVARSKSTNLVAIALVAKERGDRTIEKEARERLTELDVLASGQKLADVVEIVQSRRDSRSKEMAALVAKANAETPDAPKAEASASEQENAPDAE